MYNGAMRRVLALGCVTVMVGVAAYACSNDTFTGGDASTDANTEDAQAAFCAAEAKYVAYCSYDAECIQKNLVNCGSVYATINPTLAAAYVTCINLGQLPCGTDIFASISSSCMQGQLATFQADSGAFTKLASDFCTMCDPSQQTACETSFGTEKAGPGFLASLFNDPTIVSIDNSCTKDAGATANDASACATAFAVCELIKASQAGPPDLCADAGGQWIRGFGVIT